jgi:hypothetical protein
MKEDQMMNGQLKPAWNVQISTENQLITHVDFFSNPTDFLTFKPFVGGYEQHYDRMAEKVVADSGYGSEENYEFMEINKIEAFVKYPMFHKEEKKSFQENAFLPQNLYYNSEKDYYVCPMGQQMERSGSGKRKSESGYVSNTVFYEAANCVGCPLKCLCHKAKGKRVIEVNPNLKRHRERAKALLKSEEGLLHRSRRPIEPEAVFGRTKANKAYNRFRHFGKDKVLMDFILFAVSFNIGKIHNKVQNRSKGKKKSAQSACFFVFILFFSVRGRNRCRFPEILTAETAWAA